ncbi:MAG: carbohydrate kinase family protein [Phycisphaerales bacterium]|nr:carbohydrate kinase family protein [Phycisphaerales bacterium]
MPNRSVVVVGTSAIDCIVTGLSSYEAIRPAKGKSERMAHGVEVHAGGMALNCAFALHQMGIESCLVTRVGTSSGDRALLGQIRKKQLLRHEDSVIVDPATTAATCVSFVYPDEGRKDRCFLFHPGEATTVTFADLVLPAVEKCIAQCDHIHFAGIGTQGVESRDAVLDYRIQGWIGALQEAGRTVSADLAPSPVLGEGGWRDQMKSFLTSLDMLFPSDFEARALLGMERATGSELAEALQDKYDVPLVCVKSREQGCFVDGSLPEADTPRLAMQVQSEVHVNVRDPTGAGDVWCAGFLAAYARNHGLRACAMAGNAAAAFSLESIGGWTGVRSWEDVWDRVRRRGDFLEGE